MYISLADLLWIAPLALWILASIVQAAVEEDRQLRRAGHNAQRFDAVRYAEDSVALQHIIERDEY